MTYNITKDDWDEIQRIRSLRKVTSDDINSMKNLYDKYINIRLKKVVDWSCPSCLRVIRDELITFQSESNIDQL